MNILEQGILLGHLCELLKRLNTLKVGDEQAHDKAIDELVDVCKQLKKLNMKASRKTEAVEDCVEVIARCIGNDALIPKIFIEKILNKYGRSLKDG